MESNEVGEYPLRTVKFSNISSVTLFIPASQGADTTRVEYVGFLGTWAKVCPHTTTSGDVFIQCGTSVTKTRSSRSMKHKRTWQTTRRSRAWMEPIALWGIEILFAPRIHPSATCSQRSLRGTPHPGDDEAPMFEEAN